MQDSILNNLGFDPIFLFIGLLFLILVLAIIVIAQISKTRKLERVLDRFLRGKDAESLEDAFVEAFSDIERLKEEDLVNKEALKTINRVLGKSYYRTGLVKYDAFPGMGGKSSFVLALMSQNKSGYILNAVHSRESCYMYVKEIVKGETEVPLGKEEEKAVKIALGFEKAD